MTTATGHVVTAAVLLNAELTLAALLGVCLLPHTRANALYKTRARLTRTTEVCEV
jgi:hypothetical protein